MSSSSTNAGPFSGPFTASDGRKFAFPVGTAFFVISGILFWREHVTAFRVFAGLGISLYVLGAIIPSKLGPVYRAWMRMALLISKVTTPIFLGIVYFLIFMPVGLIRSAFGRRSMVHGLENNSYWKRSRISTRSDLSRQF